MWNNSYCSRMFSCVFYYVCHRKFPAMTNTPLLWLSENGNYILTAFRILPFNWKKNCDVVQCWRFFFLFFLGIALFLSSLNDGSQITEGIWKRVNFFLSAQQHLSFFEHNHSRIYIFQGLVVWHINNIAVSLRSTSLFLCPDSWTGTRINI